MSGTCFKSLLVRQKDVLLAPLHAMFGEDKNETFEHFRNLITLDCSPVQQGLLNINTEITVVQLNEPKVKKHEIFMLCLFFFSLGHTKETTFLQQY